MIKRKFHTMQRSSISIIMTMVMPLAFVLPFSSFSYKTGAVVAALTMTNSLPRSTKSATWRIALNIGRERFTSMPSNWASSGARMPLVFQCNFTDDHEIIPLDDGYVRYTGRNGEVVKPVVKGNWSYTPENQDFSFTLYFPECMSRNDVSLEADTTILCQGKLYTVQDMKELNGVFYDARRKTDEAAKDVTDITKRRMAPKKWDKEQEKWVKRYKEDSMFVNLGKRLKLVMATTEEQSKSSQRPKDAMLSLDSGPFPGIGVDNNVFIEKGGTVKVVKKGGIWSIMGSDAVVGSWSAEPVTGKAASYYRPTY
uniref:Uncharacterized protein n=1 Tax=Ditylum brightwellii TaxID=49249 RepID=A0A7S2EUE4_9STRA|mmetsp:Transcript_6328/g.9588  ORF Transcript_6328/g.9588 Transcript_6328/m.9588 type:complete len:311 (+) Transcript_6328:142-1074(+)